MLQGDITEGGASDVLQEAAFGFKDGGILSVMDQEPLKLQYQQEGPEGVLLVQAAAPPTEETPTPTKTNVQLLVNCQSQKSSNSRSPGSPEGSCRSG